MFGNSDKKRARNRKLVKAAENGKLDDVRRLLQEGADINGNKNEDSPLGSAAYYGHVDCVRFLLEKGAKVDIRNGGNCTPLMSAAEQGRAEVVKMLLAAGADPKLRGKSRTAAEWALLKSHGDIAKILLFYGNSMSDETADEVVFERKLGNRVLQEVFNFETLERISLIRKDAKGDVEAMTCTGFPSLEDQSQLRKAFEEHVKRGGKTEERRVFPNILPKSKRPKND